MDCSTVYCSFDADYISDPIRRRIAAKRRWTCDECGECIEIGIDHFFHCCRFDGEILRSRVCVDCQSVIDHLFEDWATGRVWDDLADHLHDCSGEISFVAVAKLTPKARASVCDMIEAAWTEEEEE